MTRHYSRLAALTGAALCVWMLSAPGTAGASTITATIPGSGFIVPDGGSFGTFSFVIPAGETPLSASVAFSNADIAFLGTADFTLDSVSLGTEGFGNGQSFSFSVPDLSVLSDGLAVLAWHVSTYQAGCPCVVPHGGETLTITTAVPVPVPGPTATLALLAVGLFLLMRAERRDRQPHPDQPQRA